MNHTHFCIFELSVVLSDFWMWRGYEYHIWLLRYPPLGILIIDLDSCGDNCRGRLYIVHISVMETTQRFALNSWCVWWWTSDNHSMQQSFLMIFDNYFHPHHPLSNLPEASLNTPLNLVIKGVNFSSLLPSHSTCAALPNFPLCETNTYQDKHCNNTLYLVC